MKVAAIARQLGIDRKTVRKYIARGLEPPSYGPRLPRPRPIDLHLEHLQARVDAYPGLTAQRQHREIGERGYRAEHPDGYRYSRFFDLFRRWEGRLPLVMRQSLAGGEKLFLDYAGDTMPGVVDRRTGEVRGAHIFVAVMGGSSLSFALGTWTEQFADSITGNNAAFAFFRGVPQLLVPDNAKVAVIKACHFDPQVNRSYTDMARHYGTVILPTRPRRPRDKAKVEVCVGIVERWLLGRLRNGIFYSLAEMTRGRSPVYGHHGRNLRRRRAYRRAHAR